MPFILPQRNNDRLAQKERCGRALCRKSRRITTFSYVFRVRATTVTVLPTSDLVLGASMFTCGSLNGAYRSRMSYLFSVTTSGGLYRSASRTTHGLIGIIRARRDEISSTCVEPQTYI